LPDEFDNDERLVRKSKRRKLPDELNNERLLRKAEVCDLLGVNQVTLWLWIKAGEFPLGIILNTRSRIVAWRLADVLDWIAARERGLVAAPTAANAARRKQPLPIRRVALQPEHLRSRQA
jgi:predicted DNA-binding transcriptional regulator AlpA